MGCIDKHPVLICKPVQKALRFYTARWQYWTKMRGAEANKSARIGNCPRYLLKIRVQKARAAHAAYERWVKDEWNWQAWLPAKWQRIARCETGYHGGTGPGGSRWDWNSGPYQGAFGFAVSTWDQFKPPGAPSEAYWATPREQYECALNVYYRFGYGAWGCGGA